MEESAEVANGGGNLGGGGAAKTEDEARPCGLAVVAGREWPEPERLVDRSKGEFAIVEARRKRDGEMHACGATNDIKE